MCDYGGRRGAGRDAQGAFRTLNGHTGIAPTMALRLSLAFGGSAESWLMQQGQYDLWRVSKNLPKEPRIA